MPRKSYNLSFKAACTSYKKSKQTSVRKISDFIVNRNHSYLHLQISGGHLIPIIQSCQDKLGIKCPLEYLQV